MSTVLITGANRGLGLEFVRQYLKDGWQVLGLCREPQQATALRQLERDADRLQVHRLDVGDFAAIDQLSSDLEGVAIDVLINNAGVYGPRTADGSPSSQSFGQIDYDAWTEVFRINSQAPLKMAEAFIAQVSASELKTIVTVTSKMGSIGDGSTDSYIYRSTKTAVNMAMATLARQLVAREIKVALLHPGWVRTDMGGQHALIDAEESVTGMRQLIASMTPAESGSFRDYAGNTIPW